MAATASAAPAQPHRPLPERLPLVIGVTGHRDLRPQDEAELEDKIGEIIARIRRDYLPGGEETPLLLLSPLAEGADRVAARAALKHGVRLIAPLPLPADEYRRDFAPDRRLRADAAEEFDRLLAQAIAAPVVPFAPDVTPDNVRDETKRALQYRAVGVFIVQHCDLLIALWDGNEAEPAVGGTAENVGFKRSGMPLTLTGSAHASLDGSEIGPVIHVVTPRDRPSNTVKAVMVEPWGREAVEQHRGNRVTRVLRGVSSTVAILFGGEADDIASRLDKTRRAELEGWERFESLTKLTGAFNKEAAALLASPDGKAKVDESIGYLITDPDAKKPEEHIKSYALGQTPRWWTLYGAADVLAQRGQKTFRRDWLGVFVFGFAAFAAFALVMHLHAADTKWLAAYLVFMLALLGIVLGARYRRDQDRFLDHRALAEALRVELYWSLLGISLSDGGGRLYPIKQPNELTWVKSCLRKLDWLRDPAEEASKTADARAYAIARRCWVYGQCKFFTRRGRDHDRRAARLEGVSMALLGVTIVMVALILLLLHDRDSWLVLAVGLVPGLAAAFAGYSERLAYSAQSLHYERMEALFSRAYELLPDDLSGIAPEHVSSLFRELGTEAMKENAEWVAIYRQRPMRPVQ